MGGELAAGRDSGQAAPVTTSTGARRGSREANVASPAQSHTFQTLRGFFLRPSTSLLASAPASPESLRQGETPDFTDSQPPTEPLLSLWGGISESRQPAANRRDGGGQAGRLGVQGRRAPPRAHETTPRSPEASAVNERCAGLGGPPAHAAQRELSPRAGAPTYGTAAHPWFSFRAPWIPDPPSPS